MAGVPEVDHLLSWSIFVCFPYLNKLPFALLPKSDEPVITEHITLNVQNS